MLRRVGGSQRPAAAPLSTRSGEVRSATPARVPTSASDAASAGDELIASGEFDDWFYGSGASNQKRVTPTFDIFENNLEITVRVDVGRTKQPDVRVMLDGETGLLNIWIVQEQQSGASQEFWDRWQVGHSAGVIAIEDCQYLDSDGIFVNHDEQTGQMSIILPKKLDDSLEVRKFKLL